MHIHEARYITLGNVNQFVIIRGEDIKNPVLLILHGGTTETAHFIKFNSPLEKHFTVVYWEQRGEGKSYSKSIIKANPELSHYIQDTHELTQTLKKRFHKEKIFLLGHSWGSMLGMKTIEKYPHDYEAYIGISQYCDPLKSDALMLEYFLKSAKEKNDTSSIKKIKAIPKLEQKNINLLNRTKHLYPLAMKFGSMYHDSSFSTFFKLSLMPILTLKEYNFMDIYRATQLNEKRLEVYYKNGFYENLTEVNVPVYFIHGKDDYVINYALTKKYFEKLEAPIKEFFTLDKSGHLPSFEEPDKFIDIMISQILTTYQVPLHP